MHCGISLKRVLIIAVCVGIVAYLAFFDPTQWPAPRCVFHALTGWECPGCGTQRAIHALFKGDIGEAWNYNPALFVALPVAALYVWSPSKIAKALYAPHTAWCLLGVIVLWWILRNVLPDN